ncbi:hypothetical protein [Bacillus sp. SN10]|uniref:hypothetical protein n=1 Tax=Bacillus sp. SN10 TaxID=2056493 RepID=UPI000C32D8F4|nr:hypothetical protein [Bacillus sp. SN10]PKJ52651.1 hypothetical protein CWE34_26380 [Bacillus sp. SN10]
MATTIVTNLNEYKQYLERIVFTSKSGFSKETLYLVSIMLPIAERIEAVEFLTEKYFTEMGEMPTKVKMKDRRGRYIEALDLLSEHLLYEALEGDSRPDKITLEERPVLTSNQIKTRITDRGEISVDIGLACKTYGSDGRNHRNPTKRNRTPYENMKVEQQALEKAKQVNEGYRDATNPSKIRRLRVAS